MRRRGVSVLSVCLLAWLVAPAAGEGATVKLVRTLEGHEGQVHALLPGQALSADGSTLVSGGKEKSAVVWDVATGKVRRRLEGHAALVGRVAITGDGRLVAAADGSGAIAFWDVATGQRKASVAAHTMAISGLAFTPDGQTLASASWDKTVKLWDVASGEQKASLPHDDMLRSVAFSGDGKTLVTADKAAVRIWDCGTLKARAQIKARVRRLGNETFTDELFAVATNADGGLVAVGASAAGDPGGPVRVYDGKGGLVADLGGHEIHVTSVALTRDGGLLASASVDGSVKLWDVRGRRELASLPNEQREAFAVTVALSADGKLLARTEKEKITLWEIRR